jgi:hypothetical protein
MGRLIKQWADEMGVTEEELNSLLDKKIEELKRSVRMAAEEAAEKMWNEREKTMKEKKGGTDVRGDT